MAPDPGLDLGLAAEGMQRDTRKFIPVTQVGGQDRPEEEEDTLTGEEEEEADQETEEDLKEEILSRTT